MDVQITFLPQGKTVKVKQGTTVLSAARLARIHIATRCGGKASCMMCKVHTEPGAQNGLAALTAAEERKLGSLAGQGVRLACQAKLQGTATVRLPEDRLKAAIRRQLEQQEEDDLLW
ncbi:ferredoxin [Paenibacillus sp. CAA11]|uniref:2Fe-2S iron-sulfur cluster-binding protein n=1 Tax=Paenibacillus sp. CAA11 TaxID=1532905 RepID=UPI000D38BE9D|nr:2Fe-2S iron-sulfur cluster-binding protein [Paenibacillus sp. CAA11]AWB45023.1 ferredoxin [Paenibacillus sp. CAA11]